MAGSTRQKVKTKTVLISVLTENAGNTVLHPFIHLRSQHADIEVVQIINDKNRYNYKYQL